jgi:hypothetical protein
MRARLTPALEPISEQEHAEYDAFVDASAHGTIFQTIWWHRAWDLDFECRASRRDGAFCTGLLLGRTQRGTTTIYRAPPLSPYSGPVIELPAGLAAGERHRWRKRETLKAIRSLPSGSRIRFQLTADQFDFSTYVWAGFRATPSLTYRIAAASGTDWREQTAYATRTALAKARRQMTANGGSISRVDDLEETRTAFDASAHRQGFRIAAGLDSCWRTVRGRGAGALYVGRNGEGTVVCAALIVRDRKAAYYLVGGVLNSTVTRSMMSALMASMIDDARAEGRDFDFEGSLLIGVERFFRGFGAELVPLVRVSRPKSSAVRSADLKSLALRMGVFPGIEP